MDTKMMKSFAPVLVALLAVSCSSIPNHEPASAFDKYLKPAANVEEYLAIAATNGFVDQAGLPRLQEISRHVAATFPITVGMTIEEVKKIVVKGNPDTAHGTQFVFLSIYEDTNQYISCLACVDDAHFRDRALNTFYVDMAVEKGKIKNIYIVLGTAEYYLYPGFRLAGKGKQVGMLRNAIVREMQR